MKWSAARCWRPRAIRRHDVRGQRYGMAKGEGGRHTPFVSGLPPQFYFRTTDVPGTPAPEGWRWAWRRAHVELKVGYCRRFAIAMTRASASPSAEGGKDGGLWCRKKDPGTSRRMSSRPDVVVCLLL